MRPDPESVSGARIVPQAAATRTCSEGKRRTARTGCLLLAVGLVALLIAACGGSSGGAGSHRSDRQGMTIPARVLHGSDNATLVFVPVSISGHGPYLFAIDTGASKTVVDAAIASRLSLPNQGAVPGGVTGVSSTTSAIKFRLSQWEVGKHRLAADTAVAVQLPQHKHGRGLDGLLGSDKLSKYHTVSIDYAAQTVTFK